MQERSDKASRNYDVTLAVPPNTLAADDDASALEREYRAHRAAVVAMLRAEFPSLRRDVDELYQHAWADLLELRAKGEEIHNVRALLKTIAWYSARDVVAKKRPYYVDPTGPTLSSALDDAPSLEDQVEARIDAAALRQAVESLTPAQATVLKLRFDVGLRPREIQKQLGLTPPRQNRLLNEAYRAILAHLEPKAEDEPELVRRQRSLLLACETQMASPRQRRLAERMVERDLRARLLLREIRRTLHGAAALVPTPLPIVDEERTTRSFQLLIDRLSDGWASAKRLPYDLTHRGLPNPGAAEQAGGLGGAAVGAGATAKVLALCLAASGTAALCLDSGSLFGQGAQPAHHHKRVHIATRPPAKPRPVAHVVTQPPPKPPPHKTKPAAYRRELPVSSPHSKPPPSPAPAGSTEFGPGAIGSTSRPTAPAAAPANGGGEFTP